MPIDQRDFLARSAAATPHDTVRGLIFNAIFDIVTEQLGKEEALDCDPKGKGRRTDFLSYPVTEFLAILGTAADRLEPKLGSVDRAFYQVGYRAMTNVIGSTLGATIVALAGRSPRALLAQTPTAYRGTVSYGERKVEWAGERHARIRFIRDFSPIAFHCGVFTAAVEKIGGKNAKATGSQVAPLEAIYEVTWDA